MFFFCGACSQRVRRRDVAVASAASVADASCSKRSAAKIGGLVVSRVAGFERGEDERAEHVFDLDGLGDLGEGGGGGVLRGAVARGRIVRGGAIRWGATRDMTPARCARVAAWRAGSAGGRVTSRAKDVMSWPPSRMPAANCETWLTTRRGGGRRGGSGGGGGGGRGRGRVARGAVERGVRIGGRGGGRGVEVDL